MEQFRTLTSLAAAARPHKCRYRPDHSQAVFEADRAHRLWRFSVLRLAAHGGGRAGSRFCVERSALQGREDSDCGQELWLRIEPRACGVGAVGLRLSGCDCAVFADIFFSNAGKNGIVLARLSEEQVDTLLNNAKTVPGYQLTVSLEEQTVSDDQGFRASFEVDPFRKFCLVEGLDDIGLTLRHAAELDAYETGHDKADWLKAKYSF